MLIEIFKRLETQYRWLISFVVNLFFAVLFADTNFVFFFGILAGVSIVAVPFVLVSKI